MSKAQVAFTRPESPHTLPTPSNLEPKHLKLLNLACTAPYQGPTANKHYCLGTSQRTKRYSAAGGGGEVGSTCTIKSKGCTCGPILTTETVDRRFCANLRGLSLKRSEGYTLVFSPLRDYSFSSALLYCKLWIYTFGFPCYQWCTPGFPPQVTFARFFPTTYKLNFTQIP